MKILIYLFMPRQGTRGLASFTLNRGSSQKEKGFLREISNIKKSMSLMPLGKNKESRISWVCLALLFVLHVLGATAVGNFVSFVQFLLISGAKELHIVLANPISVLATLLVVSAVGYIYSVSFKCRFEYAMYVLLHSVLLFIPVMLLVCLLVIFIKDPATKGMIMSIIPLVIILNVSSYVLKINIPIEPSESSDISRDMFVLGLIVYVCQFFVSIFFVNYLYQTFTVYTAKFR